MPPAWPRSRWQAPSSVNSWHTSKNRPIRKYVMKWKQHGLYRWDSWEDQNHQKYHDINVYVDSNVYERISFIHPAHSLIGNQISTRRRSRIPTRAHQWGKHGRTECSLGKRLQECKKGVISPRKQNSVKQEIHWNHSVIVVTRWVKLRNSFFPQRYLGFFSC